MASHRGAPLHSRSRMIYDRSSRANNSRVRFEARSAPLSQLAATHSTSCRTLPRRTSTPGSPARCRHELRCRRCLGLGVLFVDRRAVVLRGADATGIERQQIAIGMLNVVWLGGLIKVLWHDGQGL